MPTVWNAETRFIQINFLTIMRNCLFSRLSIVIAPELKSDWSVHCEYWTNTEQHCEVRLFQSAHSPTQRYIRIRQQSLVSKLHWLNKLWIVRNSFCDHRPWEYRSDSVYSTIGWNPDMCFFFRCERKIKSKMKRLSLYGTVFGIAIILSL